MSSNAEIIEALKQQQKRIAFDANMQRVYQIGTPYAIKCLQKYEELTKQIEDLQSPQQIRMF